MQDSTLLKISLSTAIVGIILLFFLSQNVTLKPTSTSKLDRTNEVLLKGVINRVSQTDKVIILELIQPEKNTVVLFKDKYLIDLEKGDVIEVRGRTEEFEGQQEIIADDVRIVG